MSTGTRIPHASCGEHPFDPRAACAALLLVGVDLGDQRLSFADPAVEALTEQQAYSDLETILSQPARLGVWWNSGTPDASASDRAGAGKASYRGPCCRITWPGAGPTKDELAL